jgi:hypothetical protein
MAMGGVVECDVRQARPERGSAGEQGQLFGGAEGGQQLLSPIGAIGTRTGIGGRWEGRRCGIQKVGTGRCGMGNR